MAPARYPPPDGLSDAGQDLWRKLVPKQSQSPGRLALLEEALRARDRAEEFRALIAQQGITTITKTTGAVHVNPLIKAEKEARALFAKIAGMIALNSNA
jgi:phage terminase small subunit